MVRETSHLDEMRAAIRGDFERLERRRGSQDLMHVARSREPDPSVVDDDEHDPAVSARRSWVARWLDR